MSLEHWPPLITGKKPPVWVRTRDVVLTLLAWALLLWTGRHSLWQAWDYLRPPTFEFSSTTPPTWTERWSWLEPFVEFTAILLVWLLVWALIGERRLRRVDPRRQPEALAITDHAAAGAVCVAELESWRRARVLVVHFDPSGRPQRVEIRKPM